MTDGKTRLLPFALAGLCAAFAVFVALTGGIDTRIGGIAIRSRSWERPAIVAGILSIWALVGVRRQIVRTLRRYDLVPVVRKAGHALPIVACAWTVAVALAFGTYAAGGSDSYGYVSQAELLAHGRLTDTFPTSAEFRWPDVAATFSPLAYTRDPTRQRLSPTYPPGLPLMMAPLARIHPRAAFLVVPLCAALAVWCCWRLGVEFGERRAGTIAAVLLALSPTFLLMAVQPMSDVPVTACWMAALLLARRSGVASAAGAGLVASLAILIRPNLAPLAAFVVAVAATGPAGSVRRAALCAALLVPGILALGAIQQVRYGSPVASGYGPFNELFSLANIVPNLQRYPRWMIELHGPFIWLWVIAPLWIRRAPDDSRSFMWACYGFAAAVVLAYLPYVYFQPQESFYTRFLLPAMPIMLVLGAIVLTALLRLVVRRHAAAGAAVATLTLAVWFGYESIEFGVLTLRDSERKYPAVGTFVRDQLPASAVVLAAQHSGSIRYYAGRPTLRWDVLDRASLDAALAALRTAGHEPFAALDPHEDEPFRERFRAADQQAVERLAPVAVIHDTRIYRFR